jgi:hypothetical protein
MKFIKLFLFTTIANFSIAQTMDDTESTKLYLVTDVKAVSSANSSSSNPESTTGVGKLGVTFKSIFFTEVCCLTLQVEIKN